MYAIRDSEGKFVARSSSRASAHRASRRRKNVGTRVSLNRAGLGPTPGLKPLVVRKVGSRWEVYLNMPGALAYGAKGPRMKMYPHGAMVPVARDVRPDAPKGVDLTPGGPPAKFKKGDADHLAHMIGRYMLGFGDLVSAYTSYV